MKMTLPWAFEFGMQLLSRAGELCHDPGAYDSGSYPGMRNTTNANHVNVGEDGLRPGGDDLFVTDDSHYGIPSTNESGSYDSDNEIKNQALQNRRW